MKRTIRLLLKLLFLLFVIVIIGLIYLRLSRYTDKFIYQTNGLNYTEFKSDLKYQQYFFERDNKTKIHGVLFLPDSSNIIGTIFHFPGQGMHLNSSVQQTYRPLLEAGFQIFSYERRGFGKSTGVADDSRLLRQDAIDIFDKVLASKKVNSKPIIIWGQSLGGTFATMVTSERQSVIKGLVVEGTFGSFPDIGKVYASVLNLEKMKWLIPLVMNNDFPAKRNIQNIEIPVLILHSKGDKEVPYRLGRSIYDSSNKEKTEFWDVEGEHIRAMYYHEKEYVQSFLRILKS